MRERDALRREVQKLRAKVWELERRPPEPSAGNDTSLHGTYAGNGRMLIRPVWGGRMHAHSDDLGLTTELVARGTYDEPFTAFVQQHIRPGDVVFDVGANIGVFTILLGYQVWDRGKVIAYEPSPRVLPILRDNVSMNSFLDRIEIVPKAAAAEAGTLPFLVPGRFHGRGSLMPIEHMLSREDQSSEFERVEVETEPLDVHVGRFERIDLIKVDTEGAEERVFAGMAGLLDSGVVRRVSFEIVRSHIGDEWEPFSRRLLGLRDAGWSFATISPSGEPEPASLEELFERQQISQVLMIRGS